jgi:uncharacterized repeat protein (TIGR01451 family)
MRRISLFLILSLMCAAQSAKTSSAGRGPQRGLSQVAAQYGKLLLAFEVNRGQTDTRVKFLSRGSGYTLFLTPEEAVIELRSGHSPLKRADSEDRFASVTSVLRMKLANANLQPVITGAEELPGKSNYFIGNDPRNWHSNVANYRKVKYEGVYPGVGLVYYGTQGQLEYDFVVAPGGDPHRIALQFDGARPALDTNGDLLLSMAGGEVRFRQPVTYQSAGGRRHLVDGHYVLAGSQLVSFEVGDYDRNLPLVIDPVLVYSTYLGGSVNDLAHAIAVDSAGNAYVTGETTSADFPTKNPIEGSYHSGGSCVTGPPCQDVFVTKFNVTGKALVYSTYLGGLSTDIGYGIALDSGKNVYVVGKTYSNDFPVTQGVLRAFCGELMVNGNPTSTCDGNFPDAFVTKINAAGSAIVYSTFLGGTLNDWANAVAVDSAGDAFVVGRTDSPLPTGNPNDPGFPVTGATAFQPNFLVTDGTYTSFFVELNPTASSELYGTFFGSETESASSIATGVAVDKSGKAYLSGYTLASDFPTTTGAFQTACTPLSGGHCQENRGFVAKFDPTLSQAASLVYSTYLGGTGAGGTQFAPDFAYAIAVDSAGDAYVTGNAGTVDFPTTAGAFQTTCIVFSGACDAAFVTKFNATGTGLVYSTFLGDQTNTNGNFAAGFGIQVDTKKNAYVTGIAAESNLGAPTFPMVNPIQTHGNVFLSKFNPAGSSLLFSTLFGGKGDVAEQGNSVAVDSKTSAYVAGQTSSSVFTTTAGAFQTTFGGGAWDGFVFKIATVAADLSITNSAPSTVASGSNLTYTIVATNNGPDTASMVQVKDTTPTGTTFVSVSTTLGSCAAPAPGGTGTVTCKVSSLANAASMTITLVVKVTALAGSIINDTAKVSSATFDPNTANNTAKAKTTVQ